MNIFQKVYQFLAGSYTLSDPAFGRFFSGDTYTQKSVTETSALQLTAVWGCVRLLSETVGSLPLAIYGTDKSGNSTKLNDHSLTQLLRYHPNNDMTSCEFIEAMMLNLCMHGNAYAIKDGTGNVVTSLYPVPALRVAPKHLDSGAIVYEITNRGRMERFPADKILHIKGFGGDGLMGFSPIAFARNALGAGMCVEEYGARWFAKGGRPSGILKIPTWLKKEQRDEQRAELKRLHGNIENSNEMMLLEGGIEYTPISVPPEDSQFLLSRHFSVLEIARIFRVPPHLLAETQGATVSSVEAQGLEFDKFTLRPYLTRWEQAIHRSLLSPTERRTMYARFNLDGLLRADSAARATYYSTMCQNGIYTRNECRALENMNRIEGGDELTVQVNLSPLDQLGEAIAAAQARQQPKPSGAVPVPPVKQ